MPYSKDGDWIENISFLSGWALPPYSRIKENLNRLILVGVAASMVYNHITTLQVPTKVYFAIGFGGETWFSETVSHSLSFWLL